MTSIELVLDQHPFIIGYSVSGAVLLNFRMLQDDGIETIHVKLIGHMYGRADHGKSRERKNIDFLQHILPVWKRGQAYPPPGSDVLPLPFNIPLRPDLPPSASLHARRLRGSIKYTLHAIGDRPGLLKFNKEVKQYVTVQPNGTVSEPVQTRLGNHDWDGPWTTIRASKHVSKYVLWGEHADVDVRLTVPAIDAVPLRTAIPFTLSVTTLSKPHPRDYEGQLWPSPPCQPEAYDFVLKEDVFLRIGTPTKKKTGSISLRQPPRPMHFEPAKKEWIAATGGQGQWKQEITMKSSIRLECPPTFTFTWEGKIRLAISYRLCVTVKFGGMRSLTLEQPVTIVRERRMY
ncbi:hypothetical protein EVJ58_g9511 [Rhodofomes roseus]|uniref:Arrestin-like N-terminal domain-containing protein n=1 Tax=Rhodofomes roseus TaxID=34475 RepID=A0A4Y9XW13_9APHY|nr:hypothetical protein EVJ58_g9511 [Rhodofomes roseus]